MLIHRFGNYRNAQASSMVHCTFIIAILILFECSYVDLSLQNLVPIREKYLPQLSLQSHWL